MDIACVTDTVQRVYQRKVLFLTDLLFLDFEGLNQSEK